MDAAAPMTFEVDAARGAKITSLRDRTGREWLARSRRTGVRTQHDFGLAEMAGWDECVPTIERCVVGGRELPDHGDAWAVPWETGGDGWLRHVGATWPYVLRRRISPTVRGLRVAYSAEAIDVTVPLLWTAHPQFTAPPGTRVELYPSPRRIIDTAAGSRATAWDPTHATIDDLPTGGSRKLHVPPDEEPVRRATIVRADGGRLTLSFAAPLRHLAVWLDNAAYADEPVLALEPSIAFGDSLARAIDLGLAPTLRLGHPLGWWIDITAE